MVSGLDMVVIGSLLVAPPTSADSQSIQSAPVVQAQQTVAEQNISREVYTLAMSCSLGFSPVKTSDGFLRRPYWPGLPDPNYEIERPVELDKLTEVIEVWALKGKNGRESLTLKNIIRDPSKLPDYNSTEYSFEVPNVNDGNFASIPPARLKDGRNIGFEVVLTRTSEYELEMLNRFNTAMTTMRDVLKKYCK